MFSPGVNNFYPAGCLLNILIEHKSGPMHRKPFQQLRRMGHHEISRRLPEEPGDRVVGFLRDHGTLGETDRDHRPIVSREVIRRSVGPKDTACPPIYARELGTGGGRRIGGCWRDASVSKLASGTPCDM